GAADRGALRVGGAVGTHRVAELRHVAGAGRRPTERPGVARRVLAAVAQPVTDVGGADIAVIGTGSARELLRVARAGGVRAGAELRRVALVDRRAARGAGGLEGVGGAVVTRAVAGLGDAAVARRRTADAARGLLRIGRAGRARPRAGLGRVAGPGRGSTLRPRVARRVLAGVGAPVALIERARVAVVGARGPARLLGIRRTRGPGARAVLRHVALAGRRAAARARRLEALGRARIARPVAGLGHVADARGRPAPGARRALRIGRAGRPAPRTHLGQVADARRRPANRGRGHEGVGRTVVRHPVATLRHVAGTRRRAADRGALRVGGAVGAQAVAELRHVAGAGRRPTERPGVARRVLAAIAQPVTDVRGADIALIGTGSARELLRVARAGGVRAGAELRRVALVDRRAARGAGGLEGVGGAVVTRAVAGLGDVAVARRHAATGAGRRLRIRRAGRARPRTALRRITRPGRGAALRARGHESVRRAVVRHPVAALRHIAGAGRRAAHRRALRIRRTGGSGPRAHLGHIADRRPGAANRVRGDEAVRRAVVRHPVAILRHGAAASCGAADRGALRVGGAVGTHRVAELRHVAGAGRRPTERPGVARRVLAAVAQPVTDVGGADIAVIGTGSARELLRVARAGGVRAGAALRRVALVDRRAARGAGGLEGVGGAVVTRAVAGLGNVAVAGRCTA